jgi:hypothetical protein
MRGPPDQGDASGQGVVSVDVLDGLVKLGVYERQLLTAYKALALVRRQFLSRQDDWSGPISYRRRRFLSINSSAACSTW